MPAAWKSIVAVVLLTAARSNAADPPPVALPLTQFEVLGLVQQGLSDEAIIAKLRETRSTFRLSASDAQVLKALGVSGRVLAAMTAPLPVESAPAPRPRPLPPVVQATAINPAPATPHVGTWVRELHGTEVTLKFTGKRLFATLRGVCVDNGTKLEESFLVEADYAIGPDGKVFGVITATDYTPPKEVDAADLKWPTELTRMNGMPFCFRFRIDDGVLSTSDLRCEMPCESLPLLGRYTRRTDADPVIRMDQLLNQSEDIRQIREPAPAPRPAPPRN